MFLIDAIDCTNRHRTGPPDSDTSEMSASLLPRRHYCSDDVSGGEAEKPLLSRLVGAREPVLGDVCPRIRPPASSSNTQHLLGPGPY